MNPVLPLQDEWTTYDYELGAKRMAYSREKKLHFFKMVNMDCPGMPFIVNFNDQLEYMRTHPTRLSQRLSVTGPDFAVELNLLSKEKTKELAVKSIVKWGRDYAEKVLSATATGSLYYHINYYFVSYNNFLNKIDAREIKRRKISEEAEDNIEL